MVRKNLRVRLGDIVFIHQVGDDVINGAVWLPCNDVSTLFVGPVVEVGGQVGGRVGASCGSRAGQGKASGQSQWQGGQGRVSGQSQWQGQGQRDGQSLWQGQGIWAEPVAGPGPGGACG